MNWHAACGGARINSSKLEVEISVELFDSFARLAGALSLLALYKIRRGSAGHRARQRVSARASRTLRSGSSRGCLSAPGPQFEPERDRLPLPTIVAAVWIVLSLLLLGYAAIEGELAFSDFDGLELVTTYAGTLVDGP